MKRMLAVISLALFMVLSGFMLPEASRAVAASIDDSIVSGDLLSGLADQAGSEDLLPTDELLLEDELVPEEEFIPEEELLSEEESIPEEELMPAEQTTETGNDYPIVLVHGLFGFGRDEGAGLLYWGGNRDIQEFLNDNGYTTFTVGVGQVSSNWDRACEAYAQIKGCRVDYGAAHSARCNHERYGRDYTGKGLYPEWGEMDSNGQVKKVHLIGHSMGGQTIRVLTQLLAEGDPEERACEPEDMSPLFEGGHDWISGVMSISAPHDGTSADTMVTKSVPHLQQLVAMMAAMTSPNAIYDFKLDQWGLSRQPDESFYQYCQRVFSSDMWNENHDFSNWDLVVAGARELNEWVKAQPNVYYFSWTTKATRTLPYSGKEVPIATMSAPMVPMSAHICNYTRPASDEGGGVAIDSAWHPNDGLVPVISQNGPKVGSSDVIVEYNGTPKPGVWNHMTIMDTWDHGDIIGLGTVWNPFPWYKAQAELLASLPK